MKNFIVIGEFDGNINSAAVDLVLDKQQCKDVIKKLVLNQ